MKEEHAKTIINKQKDKEQLDKIRHSCSHIMAAAIKKLFPNTTLGIGPVIEDGFYYDLDSDHTFTPEDFKSLEKEMQKIIEKNEKFERKEVTKAEAKKLFKDEPYKLELINELADNKEKISIYKTGDFIDLCRGPHVNSSKEIKAFKLMKVAGAYWRGDSKNKQLQRIYGTAFNSKEELNDYAKKIEEAAKRDHRKLGTELNLIFSHEFAPGAPFYLKNGTIIYNELINFIREEYKKRGYEEVITPQLYNKKLWEISGHWEHYKENMFIVNIEGQEHSLKPMNCPSHCLIYNRDLKSYKDLPIRIADFCNLHRNELSGTLSGLFRVRKFAQDDAHIFCTFEQIESEVLGVLEFIKYVWEDIFKFKLEYYLSTKPEKALGDKKTWDKAEAFLSNALKKAKIQYEVKPGDGAFYGPKIDIDIEDAFGRKWQCPTCQLDFNLPERFNTEYEGSDGKKHKAVMIHRAILGSLERFIGIMIEHYGGKFPTWLSPVQTTIITVADRHEDFSKKLMQELKQNNVRVEIDARQESIGKKVRDNQHMKIPYIITIGDKEIESKKLAIRLRDGSIKEFTKDSFIKHITEEIKNKV